MIPICDLKQQYLQLKDEIDATMQEVAASGHFILGPQVKAFEQEMADYCGCEFAIGVGSGTDALHLSLLSLGIGPGDEVITTPFTFIATTEAIGMVGATPVFVDIDPHTFNIDVHQIEAAITPRTKAILPVHLYGQPCEMDAIMAIAGEHSLHVVEDTAQALGATYQGRKAGTFGTTGCFSFFPSKNLGCFGDGGMVVTNDAEVYTRVEMLRRHGGKVKYHHSELGLNSRLDALQAAILRIKLRHLDSWNRSRRENAYQYNQLLANVPGVQQPQEISSQGITSPTAIQDRNKLIEPVYHQYTVLVQDRDKVQAELSSAEIGTAIYYPVPLHLQEVHRDLGFERGAFPNAEQVSECCLSLPMFPEMTEQQQQNIAETIEQATEKHEQPHCGDNLLTSQISPGRITPRRKTDSSRSFSFDSYQTLLKQFLDSGYRFHEFRQSDALLAEGRPFVLLRHDIDMELERALQMAQVEANLGIQATYFFLLRTEHYNLFSDRGTNYIQQILDFGHHLGLHFDCAAYDESFAPSELAQQVNREAATLGSWFHTEIPIVSFHRPSPAVLTGNPELSFPLEHTYQKKFVDSIHYSSDSRGEFKHGYPTDTEAFSAKKPMHLLTHPIWWSETAISATAQLQQFAERREEVLLRSLEKNCTVAKRSGRNLAA